MIEIDEKNKNLDKNIIIIKINKKIKNIKI